jgi:hypothetical protein
MPLFTRALISRRFPRLNEAVLTDRDGGQLHLYSRLLALLLRMSSLRGGENAEISRRVVEVLEQVRRSYPPILY